MRCRKVRGPSASGLGDWTPSLRSAGLQDPEADQAKEGVGVEEKEGEKPLAPQIQRSRSISPFPLCKTRWGICVFN